jgi:hypothetical protein
MAFRPADLGFSRSFTVRPALLAVIANPAISLCRGDTDRPEQGDGGDAGR